MRRLELPEPVAFAMVERLWSLGVAEAPAGILHYLMHPWVVSTQKLSEAGFTARHSNLETFTGVVEASRGRVRIGHRRVRQGDLVATSRGQMLTGMGGVRGSAGYVAIERVTGVSLSTT